MPYLLTLAPPLLLALSFPVSRQSDCAHLACPQRGPKPAYFPPAHPGERWTCSLCSTHPNPSVAASACPMLSPRPRPPSLPPHLALQDAFFSALDFAGTYGVLVLFGLIPVAMVWSERYSGTTLSRIQVVPGGRPVLVAVAAVAGGIIGRELFTAAAQLAG